MAPRESIFLILLRIKSFFEIFSQSPLSVFQKMWVFLSGKCRDSYKPKLFGQQYHFLIRKPLPSPALMVDSRIITSFAISKVSKFTPRSLESSKKSLKSLHFFRGLANAGIHLPEKVSTKLFYFKTKILEGSCFLG